MIVLLETKAFPYKPSSLFHNEYLKVFQTTREWSISSVGFFENSKIQKSLIRQYFFDNFLGYCIRIMTMIGFWFWDQYLAICFS